MGERLRVLMTTDAVGGVLSYTAELVRALQARGEADVTVVCLGPPPSAMQRERLERAGALAVHEVGGALEWMEEPWDDLARAGDALLSLERALEPDIVHTGSYFCGALAWRAPAVVVAHSCVCSWWKAVHGCEAPAAWDRYRRLVRDGIHGADAVVAPTQAMLEALRECYGELPAHSVAIHNGIALREEPAPVAPEPGGGEAREPFALAAGRVWDQAKNLEMLAGVAPAVGHPVLIAGELPAGRAVDGECLLGSLPHAQLARLRRRASVFAAPARYEPFGLSILEAAADGCALVLGDIASLRELWDGAAVFVSPDDGEALGAALRRLLSRPERSRELGAAARRRARRYSAEAMAARHSALYRQLMGGSAAAAAVRGRGAAEAIR